MHFVGQKCNILITTHGATKNPLEREKKKNRTLVYLFILQLIISMTMSKIINTYVDRYIVIYLLNVFNLLHWDLDSVCPGLPLCKG